MVEPVVNISSVLKNRLQKESEQLENLSALGIILKKDAINPLLWTITMEGPAKTPYEGGKFNISIIFPERYPFVPPSITFETKIYHPLIKNDTGKICENVYLGNSWKPVITIDQIMTKIFSAISVIKAEGPLEPEIAEIFIKDKEKFNKNAREWTLKYAI